MTSTAAPTATLIEYRVEGGIAIIELNDPPANTYTYEMFRQMDEAILTARMDDDVQAGRVRCRDPRLQVLFAVDEKAPIRGLVVEWSVKRRGVRSE